MAPQFRSGDERAAAVFLRGDQPLAHPFVKRRAADAQNARGLRNFES